MKNNDEQRGDAAQWRKGCDVGFVVGHGLRGFDIGLLMIKQHFYYSYRSESTGFVLTALKSVEAMVVNRINSRIKTGNV